MINIKLSSTAKSKLSELIQKTGKKVHIFVSTKGCNGSTFSLVLLDEPMKEAKSIDFDDFILYFLFPDISGTLEINFEETLIGSRFMFTSDTYNKCGCGNSFYLNSGEIL